MQKSEDAAIHMPQDFSELTFVVGDLSSLEKMQMVSSLPIFSNQVIEFLSELSSILLKNGRSFSDVVTFAFWCRKAALLKERDKYKNCSLCFGRGIAFHSTPSNVPVNFAFSFAAGLLAGNKNIVRLPARDFEQVQIICSAVKMVLQKMPEMIPYIIMVKYPSKKEITDYFSSICLSRIVWGGDETIAHIRNSPLPPKAKEITFADRHSVAILDADAVLHTADIMRVAENFYNDTFFTDQNACTSPRILVWLGKNISDAQSYFWNAVYQVVKKKYELSPVQAVGKLAAFYRVASCKKVELVPTQDNLIMRIRVSSLDVDLMDFKYNSGFFFEYEATALSDILPLCSVKCQTITYYGSVSEKIKDFLNISVPNGVDRVVPLGKSMDFSLIWDGYDLIRELSREILLC